MEKAITTDQATDSPTWFQEQFQQSLAEMDRLVVTSRGNLAEIRALSDRIEALLAALKAP